MSTSLEINFSVRCASGLQGGYSGLTTMVQDISIKINYSNLTQSDRPVFPKWLQLILLKYLTKHHIYMYNFVIKSTIY